MPTPTILPPVIYEASRYFLFQRPLSVNSTHGLRCENRSRSAGCEMFKKRHVWHWQPSQKFKVTSVLFLCSRYVLPTQSVNEQFEILPNKVAGDWTTCCSTHTFQSQLGRKLNNVSHQVDASLLLQRSSFNVSMMSDGLHSRGAASGGRFTQLSSCC